MRPVPFKEQTCVYAENQPEYLPLPAFKGDDGMVVSCWRFSLWERVKLLFTGRMWLLQLTFGDPLQPQCPQTTYPFKDPTKEGTTCAA